MLSAHAASESRDRVVPKEIREATRVATFSVRATLPEAALSVRDLRVTSTTADATTTIRDQMAASRDSSSSSANRSRLHPRTTTMGDSRTCAQRFLPLKKSSRLYRSRLS